MTALRGRRFNKRSHLPGLAHATAKIGVRGAHGVVSSVQLASLHISIREERGGGPLSVQVQYKIQLAQTNGDLQRT